MGTGMRHIAIPLVLALCACTSPADIRKAEIDALSGAKNVNVPRFFDARTMEEAVRGAYALSESYVLMADRVAVKQDISAGTVIGAAAVASGGLLYSAPLDLIKGAALGGGIIAAGDAYLEPREAIDHLLGTAEGLQCLVVAARKTQRTAIERYYGDPAADPGGTFDAERIAIVVDTTIKLRFDLRKLLRRKIPNYADVGKTLAAASRTEVDVNLVAAAAKADGSLSTEAKTAALKAANATLLSEATGCRLPG